MAPPRAQHFLSPAILSYSSAPVELDPTARGTVIRYAFAAEAVLNVITALGMLLYPAEALSYVVADSITDITRISITFTQWLAMIVLCLTPQLILGLPNTRTAIESRTTVYWTLLSGELFLIPLFVWQANSGGAVGIEAKTLYMACANLAPLALWRLFVLFVRPEFMGRYIDTEAKKTL